MLPGKHGLSFRNEVRTGVASWDEAPQEKPARRHDEDDNAKPLHNRKTTQSSAWHPPTARRSLVCRP
jgi:hypothetical protein